jgi:hypothetical protein
VPSVNGSFASDLDACAFDALRSVWHGNASCFLNLLVPRFVFPLQIVLEEERRLARNRERERERERREAEGDASAPPAELTSIKVHITQRIEFPSGSSDIPPIFLGQLRGVLQVMSIFRRLLVHSSFLHSCSRKRLSESIFGI